MQAINAVAYGAKVWILVPPRWSTFAERPAAVDILDVGKRVMDQGHALVCVQPAGSVMYSPTGWSHAVVNTQPTVGVTAEMLPMAGFR